MFSLLATVVTVLLLGLALLWRAVCGLSRSRFRARANGHRRSGDAPSVIERAAVKRARLQTALSADGPVASAGLPRRR